VFSEFAKIFHGIQHLCSDDSGDNKAMESIIYDFIEITKK